MKSDLILRIIEQLTQALAEVASLTKGGKTAQAQERLDSAFAHIVGLSRPLAERLTAESLIATMSAKPGGDERIQALAQLLIEQAHLYELSGQSDAATRLRVTATSLAQQE